MKHTLLLALLAVSPAALYAQAESAQTTESHVVTCQMENDEESIRYNDLLLCEFSLLRRDDCSDELWQEVQDSTRALAAADNADAFAAGLHAQVDMIQAHDEIGGYIRFGIVVSEDTLPAVSYQATENACVITLCANLTEATTRNVDVAADAEELCQEVVALQEAINEEDTEVSPHDLCGLIAKIRRIS